MARCARNIEMTRSVLMSFKADQYSHWTAGRSCSTQDEETNRDGSCNYDKRREQSGNGAFGQCH